MVDDAIFEDARPARYVRPTWTNLAFVVESLVLLFAIVCSMAIFTSLFARSAITANNAERLTHAAQIATATAEEFSSDPQAAVEKSEVGIGFATGKYTQYGLTVECQVSTSTQYAGKLYQAVITVYDGEEQVYSTNVSRYVSEVM